MDVEENIRQKKWLIREDGLVIDKVIYKMNII